MASSSNPIIREILRQGRGKPRSYVLAALEAGRVESNFSNPSGGDADSAGWRQERRSLYKNPTNVRASVRRFYEEAAKLDRGQSSYRLAADVQRPREDLRYKYKTAHSEAQQILRSGGLSGKDILTSGRNVRDLPTPESVNITTTKTAPRLVFDKEGYEKALRGQVLAKLLANRPGGSVLLRTGLLSAAEPQRSSFVSQVAGRTRVGLATPEPGTGLPGTRTRARGAAESAWGGKVRVFGGNPKRLKPELLTFAKQVSVIAGEPIDADSGASHSKFTVNGNISQHFTGDATDIPAKGKRLLRLGRAALIAAGMPRKQAMKAKGGLYNVRGKQIIFLTNEGGDHYDHLHIGD